MDGDRASLPALDAAYGNAPCGLLTTRIDGTIVRANGTFCRWIGHAAEDLLGRRVQDLLTIGGKIFHQTHWAPLLQMQRSVAELKLDIRHRDGHTVPMLINAVRYAHEDTEFDDFAFVIVTDRHKYEHELVLARQRAEAAVEARKKAENALKLADRKKDEFLATLAHELRNPLAPIRSVIELLRRTHLDDPRIAWSRDVLERQVGQLGRFVDDLMEIARITQGKLEMRSEVVDLVTLASQAAESSKALIDACAHRLSLTLPDEPLKLQADPVRLTQVVQNLLNNAAKYTPPGGSIALEVSRDGDDGVIRVIDTGIGIAPEHVDGIFDIFAQLTPGLPRSQGGLGIGLSLVKALVEQHGGTVHVHSDGPGQGSTFTVRLPGVLPAAPAEVDDTPPVAATGKPDHRILIVDDNEDSANCLAILLQLDGYDTRIALDGETGLALVDAFHPSLILLDIGLPGLDGYSVATRVRAGERGADITLVALTGWTQERNRQEALAAGFDFHLHKPVSYSRITEILADVAMTLDRSQRAG